MALDSKASAHWEGDLMSGAGTVTLDSGAADTFDVDWKARSEDHGGKTSPEELIAAAHATCFSMALSHALGQAGTPPSFLDVNATATFVPGTGITQMVLTLAGEVEEGYRAAEASDLHPRSSHLASIIAVWCAVAADPR